MAVPKRVRLPIPRRFKASLEDSYDLLNEPLMCDGCPSDSDHVRGRLKLE